MSVEREELALHYLERITEALEALVETQEPEVRLVGQGHDIPALTEDQIETIRAWKANEGPGCDADPEPEAE